MDLFIPEEIKEISNRLNMAGFECYLVGGAIRNQLLGKEAKDYDLTTNAEPQEVMKLFRRVIPTGIKHGTVTILMGDDNYEITTYRIDGKYSDGRRPDKILFTPSIEEDLIRRDFTINSLAYNVEESKILDINRGIEDLHNSVIRAIGEPERRFNEDALRLVRACRFASQLNFSIEEHTYKAMTSTLKKLPDVSKERISEELLKILTSDHPSIGFRHFYYTGMLEILFPTIHSVAKKNHHYYLDTIGGMDNIQSNNPAICFAYLLHITARSTHFNMLKDLKLSNAFIKETTHLIQFVDFDINSLNSDIDIRKLIKEVGRDEIHKLLLIWDVKYKQHQDKLTYIRNTVGVELHKTNAFTIKELNISGSDLIKELEIKPGPELGELLKSLLDDVIMLPEMNKREELLKRAKTLKQL